MSGGVEGPVRANGHQQPVISGQSPARLEPQTLEYRARNEQRKKAVLPHREPTTPAQLQENCLAGMMPSTEVVPHIENLQIPGPNGEIGIRVFQPHPRAQSSLPVMVYFHGGCWFLNSMDTHDGLMRRFANAGSLLVIGVEYRLAPEHKFPAGLEDCYAATQWAASNASRFLGDPDRLVVAGDSCGGNLAAAVCMLANERRGPSIGLQILLYPMTDYYSPATESMRLYSKGYGYSAELNKLGWDLYGAAEAPHGSPQQPNTLAAILRRPDLAGLPPAHIALPQCDIVRDEGLAFARALERAGNQVEVREYKGAGHGFIGDSVLACQLQCTIQLGTHAITEALQTLKRTFGMPVPRASQDISSISIPL